MSMPKQLQNTLLSYALNKIIPSDYGLKISSWDDIINLGQGNIEHLIWLFTYSQIRGIANEKNTLIRQLSDSLSQIVRTSKDMPLLPQFRGIDYILEGDNAVVFFPEKSVDRSVIKGAFVEGKVTDVGSVGSGVPMIVYFLPDKGYTMIDYEEGTYLAHLGLPEIMKKTDFNALRRNTKFTNLWLTNLKESDVPKGYREKLLELVNQNKTY